MFQCHPSNHYQLSYQNQLPVSRFSSITSSVYGRWCEGQPTMVSHHGLIDWQATFFGLPQPWKLATLYAEPCSKHMDYLCCILICDMQFNVLLTISYNISQYSILGLMQKHGKWFLAPKNKYAENSIRWHQPQLDPSQLWRLIELQM